MPSTNQIALGIAVGGAVLCAAASFGGAALVIGAAAGSLAAVGHWYATAWSVSRIFSNHGRARAAAVVFYCAKLMLVAAFAWLALRGLGGSPAGFAIGWSALWVGMLLAGAMRAVLRPTLEAHP